MARAIALLSGGLDSTLAVLLLRRQGIDVTAVTFLTHFGCDITDSSSCSSDSTANAARYGFEVKLCHLSDKFLDIVKNPKFGHGKNMNPCVDCRILMLKEAKVLMDMMGADFIVTGEVLGQRPMSQRRDSFPVIDREAGVKGLVLRPLSAKLLPPTIPEEEALVDRDRLCGFSGRSRKPQMALAEEFGLTEYPAPAGGCLLTEPNFSTRLSDMLEHNPDPVYRDLSLLRRGRHFRTPGGKKIIVGRDNEDNECIKALTEEGDIVMWVEDFGSPLTLIEPSATEEDIATAASITARFSGGKREPELKVSVTQGGAQRLITTAPADEGLVDSLRILNPKQRSRRKRKEAGVR